MPRASYFRWAAIALSPALFGCAHLPIGWFVEAETIEIRRRSDFVEDVDESAIERGIVELIGYEGARAEPQNERYWRVDLEIDARGPFAPRELEFVGAATLGLRSGDIVLAKNAEAQSLGTTLSLEEFAYYDHAALLEIESDRAWVYECWPRIRLLRFAPNSSSRFQGRAARVPLSSFVRRYETLEFIRLADMPPAARLLDGARESLGEGIRFDPRHAPEDPSLSCCEYLVYLFEDKAGADLRLEPIPVTTNSSAKRLSESLGFHTSEYIVPDAFARLPGARSIGILSRSDSLSAVHAMRFAYELLHASFDSNARIGSYLAFDRWRLVRLRRNVAAFLAWSVGYGASLDDADSPESRRELRAALESILPLFLKREHRAAHPIE